MPYVDCKICSSKLYVKPFHQKKGWGKYCSKKCQNLGQKTGRTVLCKQCGKEVWRMHTEIEHSLSGHFFCNKSCQTKWRNVLFSGPWHPSWKNGIRAYRNILLREKIPVICKLCGLEDCRILVVHHIDKNRKNNNPANLSWLCHNCHFLVHHFEQEKQKLSGLT
jgi:hypothetical protein